MIIRSHSRRRISLIIILSSFFSLELFCQKGNLLIFSDTVQTTLYNYIKQATLDNTKFKNYVRVSHLSKDTIQLNVSHYLFSDKKNSATKLIESIHTKIQLKDIEIPLVYDDDFLFSNYVHYPNKEGYIIEEYHPRGGFFIVFSKFDDKKIVRVGYEQ